MTKLFVGGIPYSVTNQQLEELFTKFGAVTSASIVMDKYSGQSKGFAFVEMPNDTEAEEAIKNLNGFGMEGRKIGVSVAKPRQDSDRLGGNRNSYPGRDNFRKSYRR